MRIAEAQNVPVNETSTDDLLAIHEGTVVRNAAIEECPVTCNRLELSVNSRHVRVVENQIAGGTPANRQAIAGSQGKNALSRSRVSPQEER